MQELNGFKDSVNKYSMINDKYEDMNILWQMGMEDQDESVYAEVSDNLKELTQLIESLELDLMLSGEYDANSAILTLHAGAGGTEAQDWVQMLLRMYVRYAERRGYKVETLDFLAGDDAGVKSATLLISGKNAYGYLKA